MEPAPSPGDAPVRRRGTGSIGYSARPPRAQVSAAGAATSAADWPSLCASSGAARTAAQRGFGIGQGRLSAQDRVRPASPPEPRVVAHYRGNGGWAHSADSPRSRSGRAARASAARWKRFVAVSQSRPSSAWPNAADGRLVAGPGDHFDDLHQCQKIGAVLVALGNGGNRDRRRDRPHGLRRLAGIERRKKRRHCTRRRLGRPGNRSPARAAAPGNGPLAGALLG